MLYIVCLAECLLQACFLLLLAVIFWYVVGPIKNWQGDLALLRHLQLLASPPDYDVFFGCREKLQCLPSFAYLGKCLELWKKFLGAGKC